jgi:hypothetical protein
MAGITGNIDNQKLVNVCKWDLGDIRVVWVTDFEVFYREECLKDKLPSEEHDAKTMWEQKNELA